MNPGSFLPFPTDPLSAGLSFVKNILSDIFGPSQEELRKQRLEMCSNPASWRTDVCGSMVWQATYCQDGTIAPHGGACKCPLSAIITPGTTGCSRANALKDNWPVVAGIGLLFVVALR